MLRHLIATFLLSLPLTAGAVQLTPEQCQSLGAFAKQAAEIRDLGADRDKHIAYVMAANQSLPPELEALLRQVMAVVYASKVTPSELGQMLFLKCLQAKGEIGEMI